MRAFWKYDMFPYLLSGLIVETKTVNDEERVLTREFGPGYWFKPSFILSNKKGLKLKKELNRLEKYREEDINLIRKKYQIKLTNLLKEYNHD